MTSIATPMLLTVMMAFLALGFTAHQHVQIRTAAASRQAAVLVNERSRTRLEVADVALADALTVVLQVRNTGSVTISEYGQMDVIVDYPGVTGRVIQRLQYGGVAPGRWQVTRIQPDGMHPGLWNPGETATLTATLPAVLAPGGTGGLVLGAPNGITASTYFTG